MIKIDFNTKIEDKSQAAFVILYALDGKPWSNYPEPAPERNELVIPTCLMVNRSDGAIGFIGGKVGSDETLEETAKREVNEEVGYEINGKLKPVVAHDIGPITTHAFAVQLSYEELRNIQINAPEAAYFGSEVTGIFLAQLIDYQAMFNKWGGITELLKNSLAPSVREELINFLLEETIFDETKLKAICTKSGFSLEDLLK